MSAPRKPAKGNARAKAKPAPSRVPLRSHKDLEAYQRSMVLLVHVHELCDRFPVDERNDLAEKMRQASNAIPECIADSFGRKISERQFMANMKAAMDSAKEMKTHIRKAAKLGFVDGEDVEKLTEGYTHIRPQLNRLLSNWRRS
jgi:four helix bundle protein